MVFGNWFRVIIGILIVILVAIAGFVFWHKRIDSETSWIYGIYASIVIILFTYYSFSICLANV